MKLNPVFQSASVPIPDRSGFDLSREHLLTCPVGTLVPAECFEVLPNDTVSMGAMHKVTFPPFSVPFMGRIDACLEAFFVPSRLLWKGWQSFITQNSGVQYPGDLPQGSVPISVPRINTADDTNRPYLGAGSLADYLGFVQPLDVTHGANFPFISAMKFLAYHKVCDDWYRDQNNVKPFFVKNPLNATASDAIGWAHNAPNLMTALSVPVFPLSPTSSSTAAYNNQCDTTIGLGSLRQRSWAKDYFTTMTTRPQAGDAAQISFSTSGATGSITVSDIRVANALQKWLERNNIAGTEYGSQILAHFGVTPPDAVLDKALLLGQIRESVYVGGVENNSNAQENTFNTNNPWGTTLGSSAGFASSFGKGSLIPEFHAKEHGFIMVMFSIVPHAYYDTGVEREMFHLGVGDYAWPEYAKIGDQEVYDQELYIGDSHPGDVIGYNQRYSEYKMRLDKISGLLHTSRSLQVYALKRGFSSDPSLGKEFLEIPQNYLDQVSQTELEVSQFGAIADIYFDTRAIRLLPQYSLPSL